MSLSDTRFLQSVALRVVEPCRGACCLVRIYPSEGIGQMVELGETCVTIGRDGSCEVEIHDDSVSRRHAVIEPCEAGYLILDLGSTNGTYVNDERIDGLRLAGGDRIRLGNQIFKFIASDRVEAEYYEAIYRIMTTDGLTQAYNKRYLLEVLDRELLRAQRTTRPLAVMMMDLDRFKAINDTYGHLVGDEVLAGLCRRIKGLLRRDEVLARYGGEEFALVLSDTTLAEACEAAERIRRAVAETPFSTEEVPVPVTISIGLAVTHGEEGLNAADLLDRADRLLYAAKQSGRNRVMH